MKASVDDLQKVLQNQKNPLSLVDIQAFLETTVKERTLRRWLAQLVIDGKVSRVGESKATRYVWQYQTVSTQSSTVEASAEVFSAQARALLAKTNAPLQSRHPCTYSTTWLDINGA